MHTVRRAFLLALPFALVAVVGCTPTAPTEPKPPKFDLSLNEVREASADVADSLVDEFPGASRMFDSDPEVNACAGEDHGIGRWVWAFAIATLDIDSTIETVREQYGDEVTSTGTNSEEAVYADGTTWPVTGDHTLIENAAGSYLLSYPPGEGGTVQVRVLTECGVLR